MPSISGLSYPVLRWERNRYTGENELWVSPNPYTTRDDWEHVWGSIEEIYNLPNSTIPDEENVIYKNSVRDSVNLKDDLKMFTLQNKGWSIARIAVAMKLSKSEVNTRLYKIKKRFGYSTNPGE